MSAPTEHSASHPAPVGADRVWPLVADPTRWPEWNTSAQALHLDGEFVAGTRGIIRVADGQDLPIVLDEVRPGRGYTSTTTIAETVGLRTRLDVADGPDGGVTVTQTGTLVGPAASHFAPAFGDALVAGVEATVRRLAAVATGAGP